MGAGDGVKKCGAAMTFMTSALSYAARGISVFPLRPRAKDPVVKHGLKQATTHRDQVARWWRGQPDRNVGIATGAPAGFWVLDLDGPEAEAALAALEREHGALPDTVQQSTGKGRHLCFAWDPAGPEIRNRSRVGKVPIDVRGNGGYIVAPPSIHPSGRQYAWTPGHSPEEMAFAAAPAWLVEIVRPQDAAPVRSEIATPTRRDGRASKYGEAVLDTACRTIQEARVGSRDSTLYRTACKVGGLVASGHIDEGYARDTLSAVGRVHVPSAMTEQQLQRQVERALAWGLAHPWGPDAMARSRPAARAQRVRQTPLQAAVERSAILEAWDRCSAAARDRDWLRAHLRYRGCDPDGIPGGLDKIRVGDRGQLVLVLSDGPGSVASGLLRIAPPGYTIGGRSVLLEGDSAGKVAILAWPDGATQVLVAIDLFDAWALGSAAFESGDPMAVVVAPRLSSFAGAPMGDRYGRSTAAMPSLDPDQPPWTAPGMDHVWLAVRRDLSGPELPQRRFAGGTVRRRLEGEEAFRFWAGLAQAGWEAVGAKVHVMSPPSGAMGFCEGALA